MIKGEGVTIQSIFLIIAMIAFSGLLVALIIFNSGRDVAVALEEMKLYHVRNALTASEISLNAFWKVALSQALLDVAKESETWGWASVDRVFVEGRLVEAAKKIEKWKPFKIDRSEVTIESATTKFTIGDSSVSLEATDKTTASFMQAHAFNDITTSVSISTLFGKMVDIGSDIGKVGSKLPFMPYMPGVNTQPSYESTAEALLNSYASRFAAPDVNVNVVDNSASLGPSPGAAGLALSFAVRALVEEKKYGRYLDGMTFFEMPMYLNVKTQSSQDVLSCSSFDGLFMLNTNGDALCHENALYTCGQSWSTDTARVSDYACAGYYFCTSGEKDDSPSCCSAFGGSLQDVEECTAYAKEGECAAKGKDGTCLEFYEAGECKAAQTVQRCSV